MNRVYYPIIVLVFLVPLFISPMSVLGQYIEEDTIHVLVEFEYPKNLTGVKQDIQNSFYGNLTDIRDDFIISGNFTTQTTIISDLDEILFDLGMAHNDTVYVYQISPEIWFTGNSTLNSTAFDLEYDLSVANLRNLIINFLLQNNGTHVFSWIEYSDNEVILDELF